jgi:hypothetical protein
MSQVQKISYGSVTRAGQKLQQLIVYVLDDNNEPYCEVSYSDNTAQGLADSLVDMANKIKNIV